MSDKETLYARWLEGKISAEEEKALKSSSEWAELTTIIRMTDSLALPKFDKEAIYQAPKAKAPHTKTFTLTNRWVTGIAASVALLVAAIFLFPTNKVDISASFAQNQPHSTPDGSKITLNDGSSLSYERKSWDSERTLSLIGEATFDVQKGSPFTVKTRIGHVTVLGTSFNVRSWDDAIIVECYSGKVKVSRDNKEAILTKGMAVKISDSRTAEYAVENTGPRWQTGSSKFRGEKIKNVFAELSRQFDINVHYKGPSLIFAGVFSHDDLKNALYEICSPLGLDYNINRDKNIVTVSN